MQPEDRLVLKSYQEFKERLLEYTLEQINTTHPQTTYHTIADEAIEDFLSSHRTIAWDDCSDLTVNQWLQSSLYTLFEAEVITPLQQSLEAAPTPRNASIFT